MSTASTKRPGHLLLGAGGQHRAQAAAVARANAGAARRGRLLLSHQRRGGAAESQRGCARPHAAALDRDRRGQDRARLDRRRDRGLAGPNDTTRTNGAESDDYLKLPVPYRARNGNFQDTDELLQVKGITPEMYFGHEDKPALADALTARSRGTVNINTAPAPVLSALGLSDAEISNIVQERTNNPYPTVPGRFSGRRTTVGSTTFRIDAEGIVGGEPKARIVAIVQKSAGSAGHPADGHRAVLAAHAAAQPRDEGIGQVMNMGVRAGIYLGGDRLTVAVAARRGGVQCFTVELEDLPGAHLKTELDARQLRLKRIRLGLARPLVTVKALELAPRGWRPVRRDGRVRARASRAVPAGGHALRLDAAARHGRRAPCGSSWSPPSAGPWREPSACWRSRASSPPPSPSRAMTCPRCSPDGRRCARRSGRTGRADRST